jgi:hypothetical protein
MVEIIATFPEEIIRPTLDYPGVKELIDVDSIEDTKFRAALLKRM